MSQPSGWTNPKTNWSASDVPGAQHFNDIGENLVAIESGERTIDQSPAPSSHKGSLRQFLGWFANRLKAIMGTTDWYSAPPTTLTAANTHINAASPHSHHAVITGHVAEGLLEGVQIMDGLALTQGLQLPADSMSSLSYNYPPPMPNNTAMLRALVLAPARQTALLTLYIKVDNKSYKTELARIDLSD